MSTDERQIMEHELKKETRKKRKRRPSEDASPVRRTSGSRTSESRRTGSRMPERKTSEGTGPAVSKTGRNMARRRRPSDDAEIRLSGEGTVKLGRSEEGSKTAASGNGTVKRRRRPSAETSSERKTSGRTVESVKRRRPSDDTDVRVSGEGRAKRRRTEEGSVAAASENGKTKRRRSADAAERGTSADRNERKRRTRYEENDTDVLDTSKEKKDAARAERKAAKAEEKAARAERKRQEKERFARELDPVKEAARRRNVIKKYAKTAAGTFVVIVAVLIAWLIMKPIKTRAAWNEIENSSSVAETEVSIVNPEREDGSGQAGCVQVTGSKNISYDAPGWQHDENGWWYACDESTCYVNGWQTLDDQQYHFNADGYLDTGWVALGGQGYYFDEDGVYDPNKDASKLVALTFDDGPGEYTNRLLDILEENNAVATFFMLGECVDVYGEDVIPRMIEMGCGIGNHSYDHSDMSTLSTSDCLKQFQETDALIGQYNNGQGASYIRFPYGSYTEEELAAIDKPSIYWDHDTLDWKITHATTLAGNVEEEMEGGNIVLMHDIHEWSVEAVGIYLPKLVQEGYEFVTLDELAAAKGYSLEPNTTYFGFTDYLIQNGSVDDSNR